MTDFRLHHFVLREEGLKWIKEMPDKSKGWVPEGNGLGTYSAALQSAIESSVLVSNQEDVINHLALDLKSDYPNHRSKIYSLECAVKIYNTCRQDVRTLEEMLSGVTLKDKPLIAGEARVIVTFPEQAKEDQPGEADKVESLNEFLLRESKGHTEFRLVVLENRSAYIHVIGRDSETFDFKICQK
jgi:hypothetical protein